MRRSASISPPKTRQISRTSLLAELGAFGLACTAAALTELGVGHLEDLDYVEDDELEAGGIRLVQRRKLRRARLARAADEGATEVVHALGVFDGVEGDKHPVRMAASSGEPFCAVGWTCGGFETGRLAAILVLETTVGGKPSLLTRWALTPTMRDGTRPTSLWCLPYLRS